VGVRKSGGSIFLTLCSAQTGCNAGFHPIPGSQSVDADAPGITFAAPFLYLFARKSQDRMIYWTRNNIQNGYSVTNWETWKPIPAGTLQSSPAAVTSGGLVYVVARGDDNFPWLTRLNANNTWSGWEQVALFASVGDPTIAQTDSDHLHIFATVSDGTIRVVSRDEGSYGGRQRVGLSDSNFQPSPSAWSWGVGHLDVVGFRQSTYWRNIYQE
jgi:hypothetical protein